MDYFENENRYAKYYVHKDGVAKFPVFNKNNNYHPIGVIRYANIGNDHLLPHVHDLPSDGYPYTIEWGDKRDIN